MRKSALTGLLALATAAEGLGLSEQAVKRPVKYVKESNNSFSKKEWKKIKRKRRVTKKTKQLNR